MYSDGSMIGNVRESSRVNWLGLGLRLGLGLGLGLGCVRVSLP